MMADQQTDAQESIISMKDGVILRRGGSLKFIKAHPGRKERMDNFNFYSDNMIGKAFGKAYKVQGSQLVESDPLEFENESEDIRKEEHDNREIVDDNESQKMSKDDIMKLKEEGVTGQQIIDKIVDNSATFQEKSNYSKAKYLKKKKKKHLAYFITCKPTARLLSQLYFTKAATKVLEMRPDTLAQMLTWANIKNGSNVLLAETCQGLVLGSILERLGDKGQIVQAYPGNFPVRIILDQFNFPEEKKSKQICGFSLESLEEIKLSQGNDVVEITDPIEGEEKMDGLVVKEEIDEVEMSDKGETVKSDFETLDNAKEDSSFNNQENVPCNKYYTKEKREGEEKRALVYLKQKNLDALIIATKHHPLSLMLELLEYIKPSSPIIIYCQYKEPLMECYKYLRDESLAINVNLTETWFRDMQVLPNRTHPVITMSARSGYILRALKTKKENSEVVGDSEPAAKKPKL
eukprot:Seg1461.3 transcript_id=Seg1461.3/GoldUCD/mRNA.D3Y31 product="tRNA adenine58-N1-methyltransferase" protein_id=Seg1461.3/GoldUCD/D3Y31